MRKKTLALLLVLVMLLGLAAPSAMAAEQEDPTLTAEEPAQEQEEVAVTETVDTSDIALADNDELFAGYVNQLLYPSRGGVSLLANWGSSAGVLNDNERDIYNQLKGEIEDVAANGGSTVFQLTAPNITWNTTASGEELKTEAAQKFGSAVSTRDILNCLLVDCPYELYWYDKTDTGGTGWSYGFSASSGVATITSLTATLYVAQDYQGGNNTTVNASKVTAAKTAAENAQAIVDQYAGLSDYEKLKGYKDEICDLADYNDEAAGSGYTGGYGDPWQIIYVFDENEDTNVVCEGYAKAFQYLCDLSDFDDAVCYTVNGTMYGGTGAGGHMWNIVTLGGENYLVDVTNCDEGTVGYPDDLFLKAASGSVDGGYTVHGVKYAYDPDMISLYGSGILTLSDSDYTPPKTVTDLGITATYNGNSLSNYSAIDVPLKGDTKEVTLTATATYDDNSTGTVNAEWKLTNESYWGVEISGNQLIIQPDAGVLGDTISIEVAASYGGRTAHFILSLVKDSAIVTSFDISGSDSITIPNSGDNTAEYDITNVCDQYGGTMSVPDNVQWSISGVEGVSVDETTGVVTVTDKAASGTATLTATCGSVHKDFSIDIRSKENAEVTITGVPTEVVEGSEGFELYANVAGVNPTKGFEWTSSNELVLSVQNWGSGSQQAYAYIAVKGPGTATITATYEDEDYYGQASVTITVLKQPALSNFTYTLPSDIVYNGAEHAVDVAVKSGITGMGEYTVFYNGSETAPVNAGTYDVTLRVEAGTLYTAATLELGTLTIAKAKPAITVNPTLEVTKNTTQPLSATIVPAGLELTYKSSNTRVATVDENGNVTGVKEGTATITISYAGDSNYNRASETVTVTVTDKKLVDVTFTAKDNQTYKPEGYKLGAQFSEATVDGDKSITKYIYNGTEYGSLSALPTVTDAGTYTVTAVYESDTEYGEAKATFTIEPKDISTSGSVTLSSTSVTYTGTQAAVSVTSVVMDGHTLTASVDYTVSIPAAINAGTYTVTVTGQGNYTGTATADFTITKAEASAAMTTVSADARYGTTGTVALDLAGGTAGTITVSDASNVLNGTPALSNGVLSFVFVDSEANVDKTATITIPVTGAPNYNDYTITVTVTVVDKFLPVLTVKDITTTYTGSPVSACLIRGTAVYEGATVKGTWGWTSTVPTNAGTHSVSVTFTPENTDIYANATATVTVTINKATPAGSPGYTSIKEPGKTLKDAALTTGSFKVDGEIKWEDSEDTVVQANVSYKWTFTPDDAANYNVVTGSLTPYRVSSDHDSSPAVGSPISAPTASNGSVRVNPGRAEKGDTVTITAIPDKGFVLESIVVTDRNGDTIRLTDEGDGVFTFTMPSTAITVKTVFVPEGTTTPVSGDMDFADVGESHWAYNEIAWAYENGYMTGTSAATFNPSGTVSRQQVWMILARMAGADPADMAEAKAWSVASGISDGSNPGGAVSRQQLVSLLYRFAAQYGYDITAKADLSGYPDTAALASYATDAMAWSVANGIIGGTTQGTLNPAGTANRAQFAVILWRFYQTTAI